MITDEEVAIAVDILTYQMDSSGTVTWREDTARKILTAVAPKILKRELQAAAHDIRQATNEGRFTYIRDVQEWLRARAEAVES